MNLLPYIVIAGILGALLILRVDVRRRRLAFSRSSGWHPLVVFDLLPPALTAGCLAALVLMILSIAKSQRVLPLWSPITWSLVAASVLLAFAWSEGTHQLQFQRPRGIIFGEWLILAGAFQLLLSWVFPSSPGVPSGTIAKALYASGILAGAIVIAAIVPRFVKKYEGHHILDRVSEQGEGAVLPEYTPATPECPHPEHWRMLDSQTTELEVIDLLKALVIATKPRLIVETGTFLAYSTIKMAEGLKANGYGRIITIEFDPAIFAKARERMDASGLGDWIEYRLESSLESHIDGTIDLLFSDSHLPSREQEIRRFLPQVDPRGLIVIHDASSHFRVVREAALRLEQEGLLSIVLLSTPRGVVIAQRREGRK